jgi:hypothetical protein
VWRREPVVHQSSKLDLDVDEAEVIADASELRQPARGQRGFEVVDGEADSREAGGGDCLRPLAEVQRTQVVTWHR